MGNKGKTWLFIGREPSGTNYDAMLEYGPLQVGLVLSIQNTGDNPGISKYRVSSTELDINRYSDVPDAELYFTWLTRIDEI